MSDEIVKLLGGREFEIEEQTYQATLIFRNTFLVHDETSIEDLRRDELIEIATAILNAAGRLAK